jgi:alpha-D-ribose 1-methylphosphonate 5-triphosphate diphosphatase
MLAGTEAAGATGVDLLIHCRFEVDNIDAVDEIIRDISANRVHLLAFNDHTPSIIKNIQNEIKIAAYAKRSGLEAPKFVELAKRAWARRSEVPAAVARLAAAARAAGVPMLSHDDPTAEVRAGFRDLGVSVCEFPIGDSVAAAARAADEAVVMGAPNVVRGGSHIGWAAAAPMAERGLATVLASDYWWPSMLAAAFVLADRGVLDFPGAWALVSRNAANAAGLADRGRLSPGLRGDVVLVDPVHRTVVATFCRGELAWISPQAARRFT